MVFERFRIRTPYIAFFSGCALHRSSISSWVATFHGNGPLYTLFQIRFIDFSVFLEECATNSACYEPVTSAVTVVLHVVIFSLPVLVSFTLAVPMAWHFLVP